MRTVITYGTFDLFHRGHYNILKRAKAEGDYLIVGVTGETYDTERGKLSVQDSLATRIENVRKTGFADKIIVEEYLGQKIPDIIKYHVDVLVIGSDWRGKFDHLRKYCEVKYLERTKDISSTQLREENLHIYRLGIVTDSTDDNSIIMEAEAVSGIHVESVYSEDLSIAEGFKNKHDLYSGYDNYERFLNDTDIVYIKLPTSKRYNYIYTALMNDKHVICNAPFAMSTESVRLLKKIAEERKLVLMENISMLYQHAFGQLLWMSRGNLIGDLISLKCSISRTSFAAAEDLSFHDITCFPICAFVKILGTNYQDINSKIVYDNSGNALSALLTVTYPNAYATAEIINSDYSDDLLIINGSNGQIVVPDEWWRMGYFKLKSNDSNRFKRYCSNFDGNGFRYLIQAMLREIRMGSAHNNQLSMDESISMINIINTIR